MISTGLQVPPSTLKNLASSIAQIHREVGQLTVADLRKRMRKWDGSDGSHLCYFHVSFGTQETIKAIRARLLLKPDKAFKTNGFEARVPLFPTAGYAARDVAHVCGEFLVPGSLRGGAAAKVVGALLARGLIVETVTDSHTKAGAALNRIWRNDADGRAILLHITDTGLAAIGIEPEGADSANTGATEAPAEPAPKKRGRRKNAAPTGVDGAALRKSRDGTKQATMIAMLRRPEGATIAQISEATGWQSHTVRGAFAGALKQKLGLEVTSEKVESGERIYRLPSA